jgi:hypothetical protein
VNSPGESFSSSRALRQRVGEWIVEKDLLLKRRLMQAGVSVLAGLLMSSAVLAQDVTADAGDTSDASIGIDVGDPGDGDQGDGDQGDGDLGVGDPDVSIDPNDPGLDGGDIGTDGGAVADGEGETGEGSDPDVSIQFGTEIDAPVEATFDLTDPPEPIVDMEPVMDLAIDLGPMAQSGSGDTGQKSQENDRDYGDRGEANNHLLRQVK